jgi:hypothetical protein
MTLMKLTAFIAAAYIGAALLLPHVVQAGDGHDHGAAPPAAGPALPRFTAVSETFELVGVLNGKRLTLYLDRTADNTPVTDAQIELEMGGAKLKADKHDDVYEVGLATAPKPGVLPITATVTAGKDTDLLAGELDVHAEAQAKEAAHAHSWKEYAGWAAGALAGLITVVLIGRRLVASRQRRAGAAT